MGEYQTKIKSLHPLKEDNNKKRQANLYEEKGREKPFVSNRDFLALGKIISLDRLLLGLGLGFGLGKKAGFSVTSKGPLSLNYVFRLVVADFPGSLAVALVLLRPRLCSPEKSKTSNEPWL